MNIFVGNLSFDTSENDVREAFVTFGEVASVTLIKDRMTNQPRGFGFVEMPNVAEAQEAIKNLNGTDLKGRTMLINPARPKEESNRGSFNNFGNRRPGGSGANRRGSPKSDRRRKW